MSSAEIVQTALLLSILGISLFSLVYPWAFRTKTQRLLAHIPLTLAPLCVAYELTIPTGTDIRLDMFLLLPSLTLAAICYVLRLTKLAGLRNIPPLAPPTPSKIRFNTAGDLEQANEMLSKLLRKRGEDNQNP